MDYSQSVTKDNIKEITNPNSSKHGGKGAGYQSEPIRTSGENLQNLRNAEISDDAKNEITNVISDGGQPLDGQIKDFMESKFGYDLASIRVHTGERASRSAELIGANAYTIGHDIVFGEGQFVEQSHEGRRLLAHELAHVAQQDYQQTNSPLIHRDAYTNTKQLVFHPKGTLLENKYDN